jgi:hypothetical protein
MSGKSRTTKSDTRASVGNGHTNGKGDGKVAFALGGLAGNNAHGVGFLAAALDKKLQPAMISCTSGQIFWVSKYLECLAGRAGSSKLRSILEAEIEKMEPFPLQDWNLASLMLLGRPEVYQPARLGYIGDCWRNFATSARRILRDVERRGKPFFSRALVGLPPVHLLNPDFPTKFYQEMADRLQNSDIAIAFNSYNPVEGREYVYLNPKARKLLKEGSAEHGKRYEPGQDSSLSERRIYADISAQAVRRGLWLYWYGFSEGGDPHVDGAYFREIMLSELTRAHTIYVARPLHFHWSGELPASLAELEDLKTKLSFNGAYIGEKYQIELVNKLLEDIDEHKPGAECMRQKYHHITVKEIEMDRPRGFFGYVFEDLRVFDEAYRKSMLELASVPAGDTSAGVGLVTSGTRGRAVTPITHA